MEFRALRSMGPNIHGPKCQWAIIGKGQTVLDQNQIVQSEIWAKMKLAQVRNWP